MRIVFIGAVHFSRRALERLLEMGAEVVGVCTLKASAFNADHCDLTPICERAGIPSRYVDNINDEESIHWIGERRPDVIFCFGWSRLLGRELLQLAPLGVVGFHPAALPRNRGRHPIIWALALGLTETASTFFFMDQGADTGDILSQRAMAIDEEDDAGTLYEKIVVVALEQIGEFVPQLTSGDYQRLRQDPREANAWRRRGAADGEIDWRMAASSVHNLVRALARPYVGAHFVSQGREFKVWKSRIVADAPANLEPGKVLAFDDGTPVIKCGVGAVALVETDPAFTPTVGEYL